MLHLLCKNLINLHFPEKTGVQIHQSAKDPHFSAEDRLNHIGITSIHLMGEKLFFRFFFSGGNLREPIHPLPLVYDKRMTEHSNKSNP